MEIFKLQEDPCYSLSHYLQIATVHIFITSSVVKHLKHNSDFWLEIISNVAGYLIIIVTTFHKEKIFEVKYK